eukprot:11972421-Karenia_brevis.AAC.1
MVRGEPKRKPWQSSAASSVCTCSVQLVDLFSFLVAIGVAVRGSSTGNQLDGPCFLLPFSQAVAYVHLPWACFKHSL